MAERHPAMDMNKRRGWPLVLLTAIALFLVSCVATGDMETLRADVNDLKKDSFDAKKAVKRLNSKLASIEQGLKELKSTTLELPKETSVSALRNSQTSLYSQVSDMLRDVQTLRGRFDENKYFVERQLKQNSAEIELVKSKFDAASGGAGSEEIEEIRVKLAKMESELEGIKTRLSAFESSRDETAAPADPKALYDEAYNAFNEKKYIEARKKWESFLKLYPKHKLAGNAQFWIGEAHYMKKAYDDAILSYQEVLESYKDNPKIPAAMLKQAYAFLKLNDKKAARGILKDLIEKHPKSDMADAAKRKLKSIE
jgi:tol-pal system protein YbgF